MKLSHLIAIFSMLAGCEYLPLVYNLSSDEVCYSMNGMMTANFTGSNATDVENYLQALIRVNLNTQQVLTAGITRALYLGNRSTYTLPPNLVLPQDNATPIAAQGTGTKGVSNGSIAAISSVGFAAALGVLVAGIFVAKKKKRRDLDTANTDDDKVIGGIATDIGPSDDAEVPSNSPSAQSPERSFASRSTLEVSNVTGGIIARQVRSDDSKEEEEANTQNSETSSDSALDLEAGVDVAKIGVYEEAVKTGVDVDAVGIDVDSFIGEDESESSEGGAAADEKEATAETQTPHLTAKLLDMLPPLPPTKSSKQPPVAAQQKPGRRRKRKKKKKPKRTIARVNSRENVKEMETIAEATEEEVNEGSDDDDDGSEEFGSEYSWSTDGDDSNPSRDPSPCRSVQSNASGEHSPSMGGTNPEGKTQK